LYYDIILIELKYWICRYFGEGLNMIELGTDVNSFVAKIGHELISGDITTIQVNVGRKCDLSCNHCHLGCGPERKEMMTASVMETIINVVRYGYFQTVDITGGAPELNDNLPYFIRSLSPYDVNIILRTNLTALYSRPAVMDLLPDKKISIYASLHCYLESHVSGSTNNEVYGYSIKCLKQLNELGYGVDDELKLTLVYNPAGAALPGCQKELEEKYRRHFRLTNGIEFTNLIALNNLPVGNFRSNLLKDGVLEKYQKTLEDGYNPDTVENLMCRRQICVDWDGSLYDCDFNLAMGAQLDLPCPQHINAFRKPCLMWRRIVTGDYCFGCTAGAGSSCGGSICKG